ncbi:PIN domain-containing protein [Turneriella parva]|uniref:Ribonuclease VapC n=1 Tax=Turneriella parva (strain ATCC BAA-1111 / DSM 21527 / NCTC 11395 / H) TaxID=869212 RepID=I4BAP0_TURPD|nr:PIN domain-containing protein [Turneriella parva]AFM14347.1 PilT protein domain protein [Turneriella parva DSM 21527]
MNVVVDTCIWVDYFAGRDAALCEAVDRLLEHGLVLMTPVIAAELVSGARKNDQNVRLKAFLGDLSLADSSLSHWFRVGDLRARLQTEGITVSTPDAHIAQVALDQKARLFTHDKIFAKIAKACNLRLFDDF